MLENLKLEKYILESSSCFSVIATKMASKEKLTENFKGLN